MPTAKPPVAQQPPLQHRICRTAQKHHRSPEIAEKNPKTQTHLYSSLSGCFTIKPISSSNSHMLLFQCSPNTGFPCPGGSEPQGDAGGVPQVQSSGGCRGRAPWAGLAEPCPCPVTPARHACCALIFSQQPPSNQSLLKALIKTLTFLIPSIFCSLLIK